MNSTSAPGNSGSVPSLLANGLYQGNSDSKQWHSYTHIFVCCLSHLCLCENIIKRV
jgi:hypothetical protein